MSTTSPAPKSQPQSAAAPSPFPPIAEYGFLSNCHTGALIAADGSIDWLCIPAFDSPSVFGSLLDRQAGSMRIAPFGITHPVARTYVAGTNVMITTWRTPTGWLEVRDALTIGPRDHEDEVTPHTRPPADDDADHMLVRTVRCVEGKVEVELVCEPCFDYGREPATLGAGGRRSSRGGRVRRRPAVPAGVRPRAGRGGDAACGRGTCCTTGDACVLRAVLGRGARRPGRRRGGRRAGSRATIGFWRNWLGNARMPDHRWREPIQRSALVVKGLTYMPTGATVAALTTSLPETPGGERNWDYRYTWMRDTTFTLQALHWLNLDWEADEFMQFVADLEPTEDGSLQIMYGIDGRRQLPESTRDDLSGYAGARPVRIGNGAFDQRQNDVFGAVLDSILLHTRKSQRLPRRLWPIVQSQAECATKVWQNPDQGIWEARGAPQHYVSSKIMCWVALDRAAKLAAHPGRRRAVRHVGGDGRGDPRRRARARRHATPACCASTTRPTRSTPRRCWPPTSASCRRTMSGCGRRWTRSRSDLTEDGFVLRYRTDETDDGLSGKEGTFLICSFWLVSALAVVGEIQQARDMMERLLRVGSPLGLYAEEFDAATGQHLGNFPQAFSHLALIEAAARIIVPEMLAQY